jgi:hypothetical protein
MRTCVRNPAALKAAEELHARSKGCRGPGAACALKMRTCVRNPAALKAAEELHARSKGVLNFST